MARYPGENRVFGNFVAVVWKRASSACDRLDGSLGNVEFNLNGARMAAKIFFDDSRLWGRKQKKADQVSGPLLFGQRDRTGS
jgi:hypothetical protein